MPSRRVPRPPGLRSADFDADYYRRFYGRRPVHTGEDIAALVSGVLGLCRWWDLPIHSVLDVGAGPGYWRDALPEGTRYLGIDVSVFACATFGHERRDIAAWGPRRPFDLVVAQGVLQYLDDEACEAAIANLTKATRHALYLEVPTRRDRTETLDLDCSDTNVFFRSASWYRSRLCPHFEAAGAGLWVRSGVVRLYELERVSGLSLKPRPVRASG